MLLFHPWIFLSTLKQNPYIGRFAKIRNLKCIVFGKSVRIGDGVRIQSYNKDAKLILGDHVYICNRNSFLLGGNISIGENTLIASDILITSENHGNDPESTLPYGSQELICKDVVIGKRCWIGEKAIILPGVTIGEGSIVGAGSVVTKSIPPFSIAVGNPAVVKKKYDFSMHKWVSAGGDNTNGLAKEK